MKNRKRTFADLKFKDHPNVQDGVQARLQVGDFSVSVVSMKGENPKTYGGLYGNASNGTYEVAVFKDNDMLPLAPCDDVKGWQSVDDLNALLDSLQSKDVGKFVQKLRDDKQDYLKDLDLV
jgi:hypothetical protein